MTHDPRREVEKLREHLGSHDKPLAFLIGAGASCAARDVDGHPLVPAAAALGSICRDAVGALGTAAEDAYDAIATERSAALGRVANVEDILSRVRDKLAVMAPDDSLAGASRGQLAQIEESMRTTIARAAQPDAVRIPKKLPHHALAQWIRRIDRQVPVELFTTNYDTLLERALEDERVPVFDGFVGGREPFFEPATLVRPEAAPARTWTRLWKIHGSVNWQRRGGGAATRIVRGSEVATGELVFPSLHKYDESRKQPYVAMLDHLGRVLNRKEETVLFTAGFSFGDEHINEVIFDALEARPRTHVVALAYSDPPLDSDLVERALRRRNLMVYGPQAAVVGGVRAEWRLTDPVDARTAALLDVPFDSDAEPEDDAVAVTGRFRLGDFRRLAQLLEGVAGGDD